MRKETRQYRTVWWVDWGRLGCDPYGGGSHHNPKGGCKDLRLRCRTKEGPEDRVGVTGGVTPLGNGTSRPGEHGRLTGSQERDVGAGPARVGGGEQGRGPCVIPQKVTDTIWDQKKDFFSFCPFFVVH